MHPRLLVILPVLWAAAAGLGAETYRFVPESFPTTFSADHAPVLRIRSGDRVSTITLDDTGAGADGVRVAGGPHPQTGPFFVEEAEPGDLLVVTLEKLEPNRAAGFSHAFMAPGTVPDGALTGRQDPARMPWTIDRMKRIVRFDLESAVPNTDWRARYSSPAFEMPLRPSLGSIGVAPEGPALDAGAAPGPFGGTMLAAGLVAGTRVMLPVFHRGALLFIGHGHAWQGDGAIGAAGVETSLDVDFTVEVVKRREWPHSSVVRPSTVVGEFAMGWPRVETGEHLMTVGTGPSLLQALQNATIELHHWLDDDFGLSEKTVNIFMGQATEYEIASAAGAHATIVAKVRKAYLPTAVPLAP